MSRGRRCSNVKRLALYLWVAFLLNYVDRQMVYSIFPALQKDVGFTSATLGLIGSVFLWVYTLGMPLAGWLADRGWAGKLIAGSLALWSAATWGCATAQSEGVFLAWRAVIGLTEAMYFPAALTVMAAAYGPEARSRALGFHQSAMNTGIILGGWYGGWAADGVGWRNGFAIAGGDRDRLQRVSVGAAEGCRWGSAAAAGGGRGGERVGGEWAVSGAGGGIQFV